ncbi:MAG: heme NO-binding domain-containing protein [Chloroflexi bacterium]|nr:heme NO-binding domain-containing protein [Chloroflexota bacterium]
MHGFILAEIKKYVETKFDRKTWYALLERAGIPNREYTNFLEYPDGEAVAIVGVASEVTGLPPAAILEDFGAFLGADLLRIYRPLIHPGWRTLDFLAHIEETIHRVVRERNRNARPPALACRRTGADEVMILYTSGRKMCALARGIALGVAGHYGEQVALDEETCMHRGDPSCRIRVRLVRPEAAPNA